MTTDAGRWIILVILSVIPIVNFIITGYAYRVIKETPSSDAPPRLERYVDLWVKGLLIIIAYVIYMIIPIVLLGVGIAALVFGWMAWPLAGLAIILIIAGIVVAFFIAIIAAMGIVHMIKNDQFGKAFAFKEITEIIGKIGWGKYLLWLIAVFVISLIFGGIGRIPWVGWLISLILVPPYTVFISRSAGLIYEGDIPLTEETKIDTSDFKYCIQCGASIPINAEFCSKCSAKQ